MADGATLRDRLEHAGFLVFLSVFRMLPERAALALGSALGWIAGAVLGIRREVTDANLARAFPDRPRAWRDRVARASYRNLGREAVAAFRFAGESPERVIERTPEPAGAEALLAVLRSGRGAVLITGHFGSWELAGAATAARGVKIAAVAARLRNRRIDDALTENRARLGIATIRRGDAPLEALRALRAGQVVGLVGDQDARRGGVFVDFLGSPAATARGPALIALRGRAPLFVGSCVADPGRPGCYLCEVEEIRCERSGDLAEDVRRLTEAHARALAARVRRQPEHYFWQHRRWRTRPPGEAPASPREAAPGVDPQEPGDLVPV